MKSAADKYDLYLNAFIRVANSVNQSEPEKSLKDYNKLVFYGVKIINSKSESLTKDEAVQNFRFASMIEGLMGLLTPSEFVNLFPIEKEYGGHKYGMKDYFYTRDYLRTLPDQPIANCTKTIDFLWEYSNWEISDFMVNVMGLMDDLRKFEGQPGIMKEFCADHGIKTFTMHTDEKGKEFMVDNETGKISRIKKKMPRYLKLV